MSANHTLPLRLDAADPVEAKRPAAGFTVRDVTRRYRVSPDKVRGWIRRGELRAINTATALCGRPRWVVPVEALAEFERRRAATPAIKPAPSRRKQTGAVDYYPD